MTASEYKDVLSAIAWFDTVKDGADMNLSTAEALWRRSLGFSDFSDADNSTGPSDSDPTSWSPRKATLVHRRKTSQLSRKLANR